MRVTRTTSLRHRVTSVAACRTTAFRLDHEASSRHRPLGVIAATPSDVSGVSSDWMRGAPKRVLARRLVADDPRFGGRGRPLFLVTTAAFGRLLGLGSLAELPPRPVLSNM